MLIYLSESVMTVMGAIMMNDGNGNNTEAGGNEIVVQTYSFFDRITRLVNREGAVFSIAIFTIFV